jgi:multisubunit Na+/H+ antiporter MnhB subunit
MAAFVEHSFKRGFLLDEARLRKLKDVIENREVKNRPDSKIVYRVYRGDSYAYDTEAVDDVVNEDNEDWRRVTRLDIKIAHPDKKNDEEVGFAFRLSFSGSDGCELRIAGDDRDRVFLLFSELREYVQHEVAVARRIGEDMSRFLPLILSALMFTATTVLFMYIAERFDPVVSKQALDSSDIATKLNFLIEHRETEVISPKSMIIGSLGMALSIVVFFSSANAVVSFIFPGNVFLFGKRKERFEKRQRMMSNLLWVVGVGLLVSIIGGFIVWRFTAAIR